MKRRFLLATSVSLGLTLRVAGALAQTPAPVAAPAEAAAAPAPADAAPAPDAAVTATPAPPPAEAPAPPPAAEPAPPAPPAAPAFSPLKIESPTGNSLKLGLLLQPTYRAATSATLNGTAQNLFIRRTRLLVGGTLLGAIDYFFDTDYPNLFLSENVAGVAPAPNTQVKNAPGLNVQDAFGSFKAVGDALKIDAGFMLPPMSHNAVQGAGTLYGLDYFSYTFQHSNSFGASLPPVGRDLGVELRGLVLDNHLEYRAGLFQGLRRAQTATDLGSQNLFRFTARVQANFLDAEPGFFYAGTYLGKKSIASLGASLDIQDKYKYFAGDGMLDLPLGPGVATAQVNVALGMVARSSLGS